MSRARDFADIISSGVLADGQVSFAEITGVTATASEINYLSGVTSDVQTQLDTKVGTNYTGDVNITGELLVDSYNETFKQPSQGTGTSTFDWPAFAASGNTKTLTGTDRRSIIQWKPDGTRFFVNDHGGNDAISQFNLTTANDFSTAYFVSSVTSVSAGFSNTNMVIVFSSDGQYLFGVERGTNSPLQRLTLNTAWQPSAGSSAASAVRTLTSGGYTYCVDISDDGTKFYVLDDNDTINEYSFNIAYDPSTLGTTATSTFVPTGGSTNVFHSFKFTNSGSNLIVLKGDGTTIYEYALSTAYDLSTINSTPTQTISASLGSSSRSIGVHPENTFIYVCGNTNTAVTEYTVTRSVNTADLDCEAANVFSVSLSANTRISFSNPPASGTPVVTGYQLSSASYSTGFSVSAEENAPEAVEFSADGTKMYVLGTTGDTVYQYALTTAFLVSTASYDSKSFSVNSEDTAPRGVRFKSDGTKMYILGGTNDTVFQYTLSTAYDVSTASYDSVSFSVTTQEANPQGFVFSPDGTKMYVVGTSNDTVFQYALGTAWDLTTASYDSKSLSVTTEEAIPSGIYLNDDGTKLFVTGWNTDAVYQYSLSTAYDVSTGSYDSISFSIASQEANPRDITFGSNGAKMYIVGTSADTVFEYSTSTSALNDSTSYAMSVKVVQDSGASGYTVTWPTSVDWPASTAPTLTATASAVDQFVFYTYDGGAKWYGFTAGQALG